MNPHPLRPLTRQLSFVPSTVPSSVSFDSQSQQDVAICFSAVSTPLLIAYSITLVARASLALSPSFAFSVQAKHPWPQFQSSPMQLVLAPSPSNRWVARVSGGELFAAALAPGAFRRSIGAAVCQLCPASCGLFAQRRLRSPQGLGLGTSRRWAADCLS